MTMDEDPLAPETEELAVPAPPRSKRQRRYVIYSMATLFVAVLAVVAAVILRSREPEPLKLPPENAVGVQPAGRKVERKAPQSAAAAGDVQARIKMHLARAKRHIRVGNLQSALFFLDQVLILAPDNQEAQQLITKVEQRMKARKELAALARARARRRAARARAAQARAAEARAAEARAAQARAAQARAAQARAETTAKAPQVKQQHPAVSTAPPGNKPASAARAQPGKPPKPTRAVATPKATEAEVTIISRPRAMVSMDGIQLGHSPLRQVSLAPGRHVLKLTQSGHKTYVREFEVKAGQRQTIEVAMQKKSSK
jgi:hypothetical protein